MRPGSRRSIAEPRRPAQNGIGLLCGGTRLYPSCSVDSTLVRPVFVLRVLPQSNGLPILVLIEKDVLFLSGFTGRSACSAVFPGPLWALGLSKAEVRKCGRLATSFGARARSLAELFAPERQRPGRCFAGFEFWAPQTTGELKGPAQRRELSGIGIGTILDLKMHTRRLSGWATAEAQVSTHFPGFQQLRHAIWWLLPALASKSFVSGGFRLGRSPQRCRASRLREADVEDELTSRHGRFGTPCFAAACFVPGEALVFLDPSCCREARLKAPWGGRGVRR